MEPNPNGKAVIMTRNISKSYIGFTQKSAPKDDRRILCEGGDAVMLEKSIDEPVFLVHFLCCLISSYLCIFINKDLFHASIDQL